MKSLLVNSVWTKLKKNSSATSCFLILGYVSLILIPLDSSFEVLFEIVEELSFVDKIFGTIKYLFVCGVTGAFLSIPIVTFIFRDTPNEEVNDSSTNEESVNGFVSRNLKYILVVQLGLGIVGLELFGVLVFGETTLFELLSLYFIES
jgi:hypothetical protein